MGWNFEFALNFDEQVDAADRFTQLAEHIFNSPFFGELFKLNVYKYSLYLKNGRDLDKAKMENHFHSSREGEPFDADIVKDFPDKYRGTDYCFEGWWTVKRYFVSRVEDIILPQETNYRMELYTFGEGFRSYPARLNNPTGVSLSFGDYKWFSPTAQREAAEKNMEQLAEEMLYLVDSGVEAICDMSQDDPNDPLTRCLVYYRNVKKFLEDLKVSGVDIAEANLADFTKDNVILAALDCKDIGYKSASQGVVIYSKAGTSGSLRNFYQALQNQFR